MSFTRRHIVKASATLGALALHRSVRAAARPTGTKPNIVFILADDLGYADLSCYGRRDYRTPAIDRLAAQGMRFLHGYANSPVCSATRTALITGRYQNRLPIGLEEPLVNRDVGLPPEHPTLPSLLRKAGYSTALVGKWHLGQLPKYGPLQSGYDHFWGFRGGAVDYFNHAASRGADLWDGDQPILQTGYMTDLLGDRAVQMVDQLAAGTKPFLLSLHFSAPHWPWQGPGDQQESARLAAIKKPGAIYHYDGGALATYAEMVTRMDFQVGRVLQALEKAGVAKNTIVVFTSDNGGERFSDTWPFSGKKTELLEGGIRIPAIVKWPGRVRPGSISNQVIASMDWLPTLLAAAGASTDPSFPSDGINLDFALAGSSPVPRTLCWRYMNLSQEACRAGNFKYLKILGNTFLFNVAEDPLERANLKERLPDVFEQLQQSYKAWEAQMLPIDKNAFTAGFSASQLADHFGVEDD